MRIGQADPPSWWKDPPPSPPGPYSARSRCWNCGRFVSGSRDYAHRSCVRCGVRWHELLPGQTVTTRQDLERQHLLLASKWPLRRHAEHADQFDMLVDHGEVNISCPA